MESVNDYKSLKYRLQSEKQVWVYFYAPLCGTCELARYFLNIVEKAEQAEVAIEADLNYFKKEAEVWGIESVPCLVRFEDGKPESKLYAFESVSNVYDFIKNRN
ncbi:thioredoxin family protein [Salipaludibacillus sp. CUR1]|uniref:thioredoxin family protein n=1 Tax=Salipaludibacillus sp. CUR1 TaxID=2820003 RepID=UPI001E4DF098|nr:thioredoxin family protein [Salipaludibacillus sp. CUR1]MCE7792121.1 thioredoxin family protein [Salipaludibacillus sp. CUR1]